MNYKSGVAIMVTYQAADAATGLTIQMDVYDEAHALDAPSSGSMAEILSTGRYYKDFTPDAAGEWIVLIKNNADGGEVVKAFRVATADEFGIKAVADSIESKVDTIDGEIETIDTEVGNLATAVQTVDDEIAVIDGEIETIDTEVGVIDGIVDDILVDTAAIDTATGATGGIRGADSDSLKTLSDQIDAVSVPAMVG